MDKYRVVVALLYTVATYTRTAVRHGGAGVDGHVFQLERLPLGLRRRRGRSGRRRLCQVVEEIASFRQDLSLAAN